MELINEITLRLKRFIRNKVDRSIAKPIKIIEEKGVYYLILKKIQPPHSYLTARSLDGFDFDLTDNFEQVENFVEKIEHSAVVPDYAIKNKKIMYYGDRHVHIARSSKGGKWSRSKKPL